MSFQEVQKGHKEHSRERFTCSTWKIKWKLNGNYKGKILKICGMCKKQFETIPYYKDRNKSCSRKCDKKLRSLRLSGKNNPKYSDGRSWGDYGPEFNFSLKEDVMERDNRVCMICFMSEKVHRDEYNQRMCVHHINYVKSDCRKDNLISLCASCHNKISPRQESFYRTFLTEVVTNKYGVLTS